MKATTSRLLSSLSISLAVATHDVFLSPASAAAFSPPTRRFAVDTHPRVLARRQQDLTIRYNLPSERHVCGRYDANHCRKSGKFMNFRRATASTNSSRSIPSTAATATSLLMASKDDTTNDDESKERDPDTKSKGDDDTGNITNEDDNGTEESTGQETKAVAAKPPSTTRVGGRTKSSFVPPSPLPTRNSDSNLLLKIGLPIALLLALLKLLLNGMFDPSPATPGGNFVYYQSSMYESRIVGADGNVETTRRESMRSNIPSLMGGQEQRRGQSSEVRRYLQDRGGPDRELDREIDSEVAESMREARDMMRGMGFTDFSSLDPYPTRLNRRVVDDGGMSSATSARDFERQIEIEVQKSLRDLDRSFGMSLWDGLAPFDRY
mmetsp:Transcript_28620/g.62331  ORF Transcript_28620/g.62331 Transcript_28620/m.62331 type:complete len:379 (-) Transcript_28620:150-1286(-)